MFIEGICSRRSLVIQMAVQHRVPNTTCLWSEQSGVEVKPSRPRMTSKMSNYLYECEIQSTPNRILLNEKSSFRYDLYIQRPSGIYQAYSFFWRSDKNSDKYSILVENRDFPTERSLEKSMAIQATDKNWQGGSKTVTRPNHNTATSISPPENGPDTSTDRIPASDQELVTLEKRTVYIGVSAVLVVYIITILVCVVMIKRIKKTPGKIEGEKTKNNMFGTRETDLTKDKSAPKSTSRFIGEHGENISVGFLPLIHRQKNGIFPDENIYDTPRSYRVNESKTTQNEEFLNSDTGTRAYLEILPAENGYVNHAVFGGSITSGKANKRECHGDI